jgi:hypothetical protein
MDEGIQPSNGKDWETWGKEFGREWKEKAKSWVKDRERFKPNDEKKDVEEAEVVDEDTKKESK